VSNHPPPTVFAAAWELPGLARVATSRRKRALDIAGALLALIAFAPLMVLIALAIRLEDGAPILFRQRRSGLGGRPFHIYKFRTMRVAAEEAEVRQATPGDERVTTVGRTLRRLSLDELPQLFNVLKGEMSLVGPRPHALSHDALWSATVTGYAGRFRARPGLTGRAQVLGLRGVVTGPSCIADRVAADNAYIEEWSFGADVWLMLRTIPVLFGDNAAV
jgi:putative colanic acid biosysnthesis UDP-glucose lipid carrier transferase